MSRTKKTAVNTTVGLTCTLISYIISFVLQALFIRLLGLEYSGVNSLFSSILMILNLADLGISNAILFRLYKSIASDDTEKTELYLTAYKKICYLIGTIVAVAGICCIPFLGSLVKETPKFSEPLWTLYILVLADSVLNHFINYKSVLFIAKQDSYIGTIIQYISIFLKHVLQILVLVLYKNIYLYLSVSIFTTLLGGILNGVISTRKYHLTWHSKKKLPKEEKKEMLGDVGALAIFKFCRTLNATIDTFFISKFIAVAKTAIYGSTTIVTTGLSTFINTLNDGMIASVGDLNASGDKEGVERVLYKSVHIMYMLYGISAAVLVPIFGQFMKWWIGHKLSDACFYILIFNFYLNGINSNVSVFRNSMGLYRKGWKRPVLTVIVNSSASYFLITRVGIIGAFIGTTISIVGTMIWYDPLVVFKYGLNKKPFKFYGVNLYYLFAVFVTSLATYFIGKSLPVAETFFSLIWHGLIYLMVSALAILILGSFLPSQKEMISYLLSLLKRKVLKR